MRFLHLFLAIENNPVFTLGFGPVLNGAQTEHTMDAGVGGSVPTRGGTFGVIAVRATSNSCQNDERIGKGSVRRGTEANYRRTPL